VFSVRLSRSSASARNATVFLPLVYRYAQIPCCLIARLPALRLCARWRFFLETLKFCAHAGLQVAVTDGTSDPGTCWETVEGFRDVFDSGCTLSGLETCSLRLRGAGGDGGSTGAESRSSYLEMYKEKKEEKVRIILHILEKLAASLCCDIREFMPLCVTAPARLQNTRFPGHKHAEFRPVTYCYERERVGSCRWIRLSIATQDGHSVDIVAGLSSHPLLQT
jgi:hypothetical protein